MIDTGRDAHSVIAGLREQKVYIGRVWPVWPKAVRVSVGSPEDMAKFRAAYKVVMEKPAMATTATPARLAGLPGVGKTTFLS
jgi:histidinol-phosphate aminotransferase